MGKKTEAEHERVKWEGEALRGENEGVLRRGRGESERNNLKTVRAEDCSEYTVRADRVGTRKKKDLKYIHHHQTGTVIFFFTLYLSHFYQYADMCVDQMQNTEWLDVYIFLEVLSSAAFKRTEKKIL